MWFSFKMARRFLTSNKSQTFWIIMGIAVGVSVQVFVGSLIQGLQADLVDKTVGNSPQINIYSTTEEEIFDGWESMKTQIEQIEGISSVVTAVDSGAFIVSVNPDKPTGVLLRGFDLNAADQIYGYYESGTFTGTKPQNVNEVIIGSDLSEELEIGVGENITIKKNPNPLLDEFNLTITGIYDLGVSSINSLWVITQNTTVANIFDLGLNITSLNIQVEDVFEADIIAQTIASTFDLESMELEITNWKDNNQDLLSALDGQTYSSLMIQIFVIMSVVIGIASVLAIVVMQKSKQIGILKAMGTDDRTASSIFVLQGFLLGIGGAIVGVGLALGLSWAFSTFALNPDGTPVIPLLLNWKFIALSAGIAVIASMASAIIPALKSKKVTIIEVIRNG